MEDAAAAGAGGGEYSPGRRDPGGGEADRGGARSLGVSPATLHRWRKEYGSADRDAIRRLKELEKENARLKPLVADQRLDIQILKEAAKGEFRARRPRPPPQRQRPEFICSAVKRWCAQSGTGTLYIDPGAPWQNDRGERQRTAEGRAAVVGALGDPGGDAVPGGPLASSLQPPEAAAGAGEADAGGLRCGAAGHAGATTILTLPNGVDR